MNCKDTENYEMLVPREGTCWKGHHINTFEKQGIYRVHDTI